MANDYPMCFFRNLIVSFLESVSSSFPETVDFSGVVISGRMLIRVRWRGGRQSVKKRLGIVFASRGKTHFQSASYEIG